MDRFKGKKLLHIGKGGISVAVIDYAKSEGAYVISLDSNEPADNRYRDRVDEVVSVPVDDTERIIEYAIANNVDAVSNNGTETGYEIARIVNEAIGNKYWHTACQWNSFMNKANFRKLCNQHEIPTPKTFYYGPIDNLSKASMSNFSYPLIVKPVDNSGGRGISVCRNSLSLQKAMRTAVKNSRSAEIIIEEYIEGTDFTYTYVIQNNNCKLISCADRYTQHYNHSTFGIPNLLVSPSSCYQLFMDKCHNQILGMFNSEGLDNCTIFIQGVCRGDELFIFEAGLRFEGAFTSTINAHHNHQDFFKFMIDYLLKAETEYDIEQDSPLYNGSHTVIYGYYLKHGIIRKIEGLEYMYNDPAIYSTYVFKSAGDGVKKSKVFNEFRLAAILIDSNNYDHLANLLNLIYNNVNVYDLFHKQMLYKDIDIQILERLFRNEV